MNKLTIILLALVLSGSSLYARFSISGEYRPRTAYNHGLKKPAAPGQDAVIWTDQRTRLNS